eukprot:m.159357 g.159357  ORF g.159357 m.159357 type:complete len:163 (+) comp11781_c0_seq1:74-562(+)
MKFASKLAILALLAACAMAQESGSGEDKLVDNTGASSSPGKKGKKGSSSGKKGKGGSSVADAGIDRADSGSGSGSLFDRVEDGVSGKGKKSKKGKGKKMSTNMFGGQYSAQVTAMSVVGVAGVVVGVAAFTMRKHRQAGYELVEPKAEMDVTATETTPLVVV